MIKKLITLFIPVFLFSSLIFPAELNAISAEDRLIEVERQLQAIAEEVAKDESKEKS